MPALQPPSATAFFAKSISTTTPAPSDWVAILWYNDVGLQLNTTGTLAGSWKIEVSLDDGKNASDITASFSPAFTAAAGAATSQFGQLLPVVAKNIRVTFTATSGAGVATASICLKASTN